MFARISTIITTLFFAMLAAATAVPRTDPPPATGSQCTAVGGDVNCCNSVQDASNPIVGLLAGLLGIVLGPIQGLVGLTCNPISVIGGGNSCSSQTVCCTGNNFSGGLLVIGCSPINIDL
uniref:Class I hydrophobin 2 n=1 Tax=Agaricus bisporus TaxID=5341 RepID=HYPD_AGABI|nr:RecName: Full=Hydrophobin-3; Flags: Precursor [Agaricus bisporus]CAA74939.1 hydrophobin [Agaricus bisporus]